MWVLFGNNSIIVSTPDGSKSATIQVKTNSNGSNKWILNKKSETFYSSNHYYVFVALKAVGERPKYHIVPSQDVANYTVTSHETWLTGKKSDGTARKDSAIRNFNDSDGKYLEAWHLINI